MTTEDDVINRWRRIGVTVVGFLVATTALAAYLYFFTPLHNR